MGCKQDVSDYKEQKRGCCEDPEPFRFIHFQLGATAHLVKKVSEILKIKLIKILLS